MKIPENNHENRAKLCDAVIDNLCHEQMKELIYTYLYSHFWEDDCEFEDSWKENFDFEEED
jgi:hypothetical protein